MKLSLFNHRNPFIRAFIGLCVVIDAVTFIFGCIFAIAFSASWIVNRYPQSKVALAVVAILGFFYCVCFLAEVLTDEGQYKD